jgi:hypothetical protein
VRRRPCATPYGVRQLAQTAIAAVIHARNATRPPPRTDRGIAVGNVGRWRTALGVARGARPYPLTPRRGLGHSV